MKGNPAVPGGPSASKPTCSNTRRGYSSTSFFFAFGNPGVFPSPGTNAMARPNSTAAQEVARAASQSESAQIREAEPDNRAHWPGFANEPTDTGCGIGLGLDRARLSQTRWTAPGLQPGSPG